MLAPVYGFFRVLDKKCLPVESGRFCGVVVVKAINCDDKNIGVSRILLDAVPALVHDLDFKRI